MLDIILDRIEKGNAGSFRDDAVLNALLAVYN